MRSNLFMIFSLFVFLTTSGCSNAAAVGAPAIEATPSGATLDKVSVETCVEPGEGQYQLIYTAKGVCFLYPDSYDVFQGDERSLTLYEKSLLNAEAPLATLHFEAANGRSLDDVVAQMMISITVPSDSFETTEVGGVPATVIDNMPGQDTNRRVIVVYEDRIYDLMVARIGPEYGAVGERAEELFDLLTSSMRFIGVEPEAPLLAGPECPEVEAGTSIYTNTDGGYCFLFPTEYMLISSATESGKISDASFFIGTMQDVSHPRLFIGVENADGRNLETVTTELVNEIESTVPGAEVTWSFGYMLDGVPANQFDQVPGQDFSRQVLMVKDDLLYTLTFIPDDPGAGSAHEEMETLYEMVMDSFSFLWR